MPTGRNRGIEIEQPFSLEDDPERTPADAIAESTIQRVLSSMEPGGGENLQLKVYRVTQNADGTANKSATRPLLFVTDATQYDDIFNRLYRHYGAGLYRIEFRVDGMLRAYEDLAIETPAGYRTQPIAPEPPSNPQNGQTDGNTFGPAIAEMLRANNAAMLDELRRMREQPQAPDNLANLERLSTIMRNLQPQQRNGGLSVQDMISLVTLGKSFAGGGGDGETNIWDIVKGIASPEVLTAVTASLAAANAAKPQPQRIAPPAPQGNPAGAAPAAEQSNGRDTTQAAQNLQPQTPEALPPLNISFLIRALLKAAAMNSPPELYCDFTLDQIPIDYIARLTDTPEPLETLAKGAPEILQRREWFTRYIDLLRASVAEWRGQEPEGDNETRDGNGAAPNANGDTGRPGGDSGNSGPHGAANAA